MVIIAQPSAMFGPAPVVCVCPHCGQTAQTNVVATSGTATYLCACAICLCFWPCFWIPFVVDGTKDVEHRCGACSAVVGTYKRLS
ncbi:LPS-induced tumor necrosis factor alpha factor [Zopfochytrium polystomum]|nr:LPS-induced tumor necrosis factor alpha factor [Zopfochytrium polystomum]